MKKSKILFILLTVFVANLMLISCKEELGVEEIIPVFNPVSHEFNVDYKAGEQNIEMNSNVIFYARVESSDESWLSCKFDSSCTILVAKYIENDTTIQRVGHIIVSKSGVEDTLTIIQAGNPNVNNGKEQKTDLAYTISSQGGYTILNTVATESNKIPVGAIVTVVCKADVGSISFMNPSTYATYVEGSPMNNKFTFVWTHDMRNITVQSGIMGILRDGLEVTEMYCTYKKTNLEFSTSTQGGYEMLNVDPEISATIPVGATVLLNCTADAGTISLLNPSTYAEYAGGTPVNNVISFTWTKEMADMTAESGILGVRRDGIEISSICYLYSQGDMAFTTANMGGYNVFNVTSSITKSIPLGATVVIETASDVGTISFLNESTYAAYAEGAPVNGIFSFVWTADMVKVTTAKNKGMMGIMRGGFTPSVMYYHN